MNFPFFSIQLLGIHHFFRNRHFPSTCARQLSCRCGCLGVWLVAKQTWIEMEFTFQMKKNGLPSGYDYMVMTNSSPWKITMLLNHLFLWAIYSMAMLNNQMVIRNG
jgi:hypothetical protein